MTPEHVRIRSGMISFPRLVRAWVVIGALWTVHAWWGTRSELLLGIAVYSTVGLLRVPRWRLLLEQSMATSLSVGHTHGALSLSVTAVVATAFLYATWRYVRPEVGVQPFVGFDLCHVLLTSRDRPSTSHHFLELSAPFDRAQLARAIEALIRDVPRLRSFVREAPLGSERFVASALWTDVDTLISWREMAVDPVADGWFGRPFDLATEPPMRVFHAPRAAGGYMFGLTLHHSVADGSGAMVLLDGLLRRYDRLGGHDVPIPPILSDGPPCRRLALRFGMRSVLEMLVFAAHRKTWGLRSATMVGDPTPRPDRFARMVLDIPVDLWEALVRTATSMGCTPNHLLLAASLRAADDVRRALGLPDEVFRVVVPSDLRSLFHLPRSLPNYIGTVPLDISADEVRTETLPSLVKERVREGRVARAQMCFPIQIGVLGLLPPWIARRVMRAFDEDPETAAFSFLFSHIRVPRDLHLVRGIELTRLWCASTQQRQLSFGVAVTTVGSRTWALFQYLEPYVAADTVTEFEHRFLAHLGAFVELHAETQCARERHPLEHARSEPCASA